MGGRLAGADIAELLQRYDDGEPIIKIARHFDRSRSAVVRYIRRHRPREPHSEPTVEITAASPSVSDGSLSPEETAHFFSDYIGGHWAGKSYSTLSLFAGVSQRCVASYAEGRAVPPSPVAARIFKAFGDPYQTIDGMVAAEYKPQAK
ncbi:hypothetical protein HYY74_05880 [Candidatus Woesearchaeota archaeon]|nr:hypothetical protein [Candidatus Woesearchaeota archaeon]